MVDHRSTEVTAVYFHTMWWIWVELVAQYLASIFHFKMSYKIFFRNWQFCSPLI